MWEDQEFLICVKTYPEYSASHIETVCTAAVLKDSGRLIRLYPINFRYLPEDRQFRKYQWVRAMIKKRDRDNRPESYSIKHGSITLGEIIGTRNGWSLRKRFLLLCPQISYRSIEDLQAKQLEDGTSLGLIKPRSITGFQIQKKTHTEIKEETEKKDQILSQRNFLVEKKDLGLIPYKFLISFTCDHPDCTGHTISILDWEFGELYRKVCKSLNWESKIMKKVRDICSERNDVYFFMGNMARRRHIFCVLGLFYPPKTGAVQMSLFPSK